MMRLRLCQARLAERNRNQRGTGISEVMMGRAEERKTKKSGLKAVTLIAAINPVSQVLW
jgi:hypothetical protein